MPYARRRIRQLTTPAEFKLVEASSPAAIRKLSTGELRSNISRTRRLRDKQRDLHRRHRLARRERTGTKYGGAERTAQKAQILDRTLSRFVKRLEKVEAKPPEPKLKRARRASPGKGPKPRVHGAGRKSGQAALLQKARTPRMKAMQAHVSSRGRRSQARRDSR